MSFVAAQNLLISMRETLGRSPQDEALRNLSQGLEQIARELDIRLRQIEATQQHLLQSLR